MAAKKKKAAPKKAAPTKQKLTRLYAPGGVTTGAIAHGKRVFEVDNKGWVEVPNNLVEDSLIMGCTRRKPSSAP